MVCQKAKKRLLLEMCEVVVQTENNLHGSLNIFLKITGFVSIPVTLSNL